MPETREEYDKVPDVEKEIVQNKNSEEMKTKITDTSNTINAGGRAEKYWKHKSVKSHSSSPARSRDDVDLQSILQRYNLKGFEFGNWLNNNERYDRVLACEDSLAELAKIMGSKNLGMNRLTGIAFGARGSKGALAHYEPGYNMINITKEKGDGCLAHEYGHALDYNIGRYYDQNKYYNYLSGGGSSAIDLTYNGGGKIRNTMNLVMELAMKIIKPRLAKRSSYWKERCEVFARLFEQYCCYKLKQEGCRDRFLTDSWSNYISSPVYFKENEFIKLLPAMDKLIGNMKVALNSK